MRIKVRAYTGNYEDVTIHNAENVYLDMVAVGRELLDGRQVDMIALSGTWHSLVLCDGAMKPGHAGLSLVLYRSRAGVQAAAPR